MRTTLDLDKPILDRLKDLQKKEKRSLGRIASELLADALDARSRTAPERTRALKWNPRAMESLMDLRDKDAVYAALDEDPR